MASDEETRSALWNVEEISSDDEFENGYLINYNSENEERKNLFLDAESSDIQFVFGKAKRTRIPAHKTLLMLQSDVFKRMFYGELKEEGDVTIVDASASAFKEFLQFFYFNRIHLTMDNISDVVNLCKKYNVAAGLNICERFMIDSLTNDNVDDVCFGYSLAILYDLNKLKKKCELKIAAYTHQVFKSSSFLQCSRSVLSHILKLDQLSCRETKVFDACMAWVKVASNEQTLTEEMVHKHLGDLFYQIRFCSMKIEEFSAMMPLYGTIFSRDETQEILQIITNIEYQPKMFNRKYRFKSE